MNESKAKSANIQFAFTKELDAIVQEKTRSEKDNKLIYHDREPAPEALSPIDKAFIAKPLAPPERFCPNMKGERQGTSLQVTRVRDLISRNHAEKNALVLVNLTRKFVRITRYFGLRGV